MNAKFCFFSTETHNTLLSVRGVPSAERNKETQDEVLAAELLNGLRAINEPRQSVQVTPSADQRKRKFDADSASSELGLFGPIAKTNRAKSSSKKTMRLLKQAVHLVRGNSTATENCLFLAEAMLKFLTTGEYPTKPASEEIGSEFHLNFFLYDNNTHLQSTAPITEKTTAKMTPMESVWHTRADTSCSSHLRLSSTPHTIQLASAPISQINQELIDHAQNQPSKRICGALFLWGVSTIQEPGELGDRPGHTLAFYVENNQVWYVDGQSIMNGVENSNSPAIFHHLENEYPFVGVENNDFDDGPFSPYVFYTLLPAAQLHCEPQEAMAQSRGLTSVAS